MLKSKREHQAASNETNHRRSHPGAAGFFGGPLRFAELSHSLARHKGRDDTTGS